MPREQDKNNHGARGGQLEVGWRFHYYPQDIIMKDKRKCEMKRELRGFGLGKLEFYIKRKKNRGGLEKRGFLGESEGGL
ncbi:uncharacterized protein J3R85_013735 [Psidium guajava]|nr:uncharacterized protein J3R85_013735 [Psidium guajava]